MTVSGNGARIVANQIIGEKKMVNTIKTTAKPAIPSASLFMTPPIRSSNTVIANV